MSPAKDPVHQRSLGPKHLQLKREAPAVAAVKVVTTEEAMGATKAAEVMEEVEGVRARTMDQTTGKMTALEGVIEGTEVQIVTVVVSQEAVEEPLITTMEELVEAVVALWEKKEEGAKITTITMEMEMAMGMGTEELVVVETTMGITEDLEMGMEMEMVEKPARVTATTGDQVQGQVRDQGQEMEMEMEVEGTMGMGMKPEAVVAVAVAMGMEAETGMEMAMEMEMEVEAAVEAETMVAP